MANDVENALKAVAAQISAYVRDVATLSVETKYLEVGTPAGAASAPQTAAKTVIKLDGDSETIVPLQASSTGQLEVDTALFDIHQRNVNAAIDYRARMLAALLEALRAVRP
jgi:hypothetical protein